MKKIFKYLLIFLFIIFTFTLKANAEEIFKITSANFDTSNAMIMLSAKEGNAGTIMESVRLVTLENPKRAYFDIDSAVLSIPKQDWTFNSQGIKQVKISQFSTNPNKVRVVMYYDEGYDISQVKFLRLKNNIILKLKNNGYSDTYFQNTYRDEHASSSDFYEYLTVTTPVTKKDAADDIVDQLQRAFNTTIPKLTTPEQSEKLQLRLNTKYYIENVTAKPNAVLINGFGALTIEKPLILTNPSRIVFDLSNTLVAQNLRNKTFKLNDTDSFKIGQFSVNKARVVITTNAVEDYIPIFSSDNQSLLIANYKTVKASTLYSNTNNMIAFSNKKIDAQTSAMTLSFNAPVVHGIDRTNTEAMIYLYNTNNYNETTFKNTFANTAFAKAKVELIPQIGLKVSVPIQQNSLINTYLGADGKTIKLQVKAPKAATTVATTKPATTTTVTTHAVTTKVPKGTRKVVIDAGHGGSDYGAIRNGINEKDITLDVAKRVEALLKKEGYAVKMTRTSDVYVSLQGRCDISNAYDPDIFVSIHVNSSVRPEITGIETHYYHQESMSLAQTLHSSLASNINSKNRGLFKSKFYVINHTTAPSILMEIGFISNDGERAQLVSEKRKQDTAKSIAEGVKNYFKQNK